MYKYCICFNHYSPENDVLQQESPFLRIVAHEISRRNDSRYRKNLQLGVVIPTFISG